MILLLIGLIFALVYVIAFVIWIMEIVKSLIAIKNNREYSSGIIWYIPIWVMIICALGITFTEILKGEDWLIYLIVASWLFVIYLVLNRISKKD